MKKLVVATLSLLVCLGVFSGISQASDKCLTWGIIPAEDPEAMIQSYIPMVKWMEKESGLCIKLTAATDYTGIIEAMRAKRVDIAFFGPFSFVLAQERAGAEAFAVGMDKNGKTTYRSYLVATPEAAHKLGITKPLEGEAGMKELKEKLGNRKEFTFTFTDTASTSGYAIPRYFMMKVGLDPDKVFRKVGFIGEHDASELVVRNKIIDIGADNDVTYPKMVEAGKISPETNIIIWKSMELPGSPTAVRKDLPAGVKEKLRKALLNVPKNIVTGYGKITGYRVISDSEYAVIKDVKKAVDSIK